MCIQVNVQLPRGGAKIFDVCDRKEQLRDITVWQLKQKIAEKLRTGDDLRIISESKVLEEGSTLESSGIRHMSTVHTVVRLPGGF